MKQKTESFILMIIERAKTIFKTQNYSRIKNYDIKNVLSEHNEIFLKKNILNDINIKSQSIIQHRLNADIYQKYILVIGIYALLINLYQIFQNNYKDDLDALEAMVEEIDERHYSSEADINELIAELEELDLDRNHPLYQKVKKLLKRLKYLISKYNTLASNIFYIIIILLFTLVFLSFYKQLGKQLIELQAKNLILEEDIDRLRLNVVGLLNTANKLLGENKELLALLKDYESYQKKALEGKVAGLSQSESLMERFMRIKNFVIDLIRSKNDNWRDKEVQEFENYSDEILRALYEMNSYWQKFL